jgi:hypothetical protein
MAGELDTLRAFRDQYLLTNPVGEALVEGYYSVSPPIADSIAEHDALRTVVRTGLTPVVAMSKMALHAQWVFVLAMLAVAGAAAGVWMRQRRVITTM